jgi:hypothetical protein
MNKQEHLLTILSEECAEVAQCASKALRFGLKDIKPGTQKQNTERIMEEFYDLVATMEKLQSYNVLPEWGEDRINFHKEAKKSQVEKFLDYSEKVGTLQKHSLPLSK